MIGEQKRFARMAVEEMRNRYGRGKGSDHAWAHMSHEQRQNALRAYATKVVLSWDPETSRITLAGVHEIMQAIICALPEAEVEGA